jgi:hypothetical protein
MNVQSPPQSSCSTVTIQVAGAELEFSPRSLSDSTPTGRQIVEAARNDDPTEFIVLHWFDGGRIDEVGLDEVVDLERSSKDRFIVVRSDRTYRFELDGHRNEWAVPLVTGATLKRLAAKDGNYDVFLERTDAPDMELEDETHVSLGGEGVERFYTKKAKNVTIKVNNKPVLITKGRHTGAEIKQAAIGQGVQIQMDFLLSLIRENGGEDMIGDADIVKVKDGMCFTAVADDDASME